ncbi:MAG: type II secretion system protein [Meiothermus sp.]|nr:type II secretion system protein [Meiothermus sp.]
MNNKGFSLLEVLIATAVVGAGIVLLGIFYNSFKVTRQAQIDTQAQTFARSYFDATRARWNSPASFKAATAVVTDVAAPSGYTYTVAPKTPLAGTDTLRELNLNISTPDGRTLSFSSSVVLPAE